MYSISDMEKQLEALNLVMNHLFNSPEEWRKPLVDMRDSYDDSAYIKLSDDYTLAIETFEGEPNESSYLRIYITDKHGKNVAEIMRDEDALSDNLLYPSNIFSYLDSLGKRIAEKIKTLEKKLKEAIALDNSLAGISQQINHDTYKGQYLKIKTYTNYEGGKEVNFRLEETDYTSELWSGGTQHVTIKPKDLHRSKELLIQKLENIKKYYQLHIEAFDNEIAYLKTQD